MKIKQGIGIFFIISSCLFGEIREVTTLSELSNDILGTKAVKTSKIEKVEKNVSKISEEKKMIPSLAVIPKHSRNISQKDSSRFADISEQDNRNGVIYRQGERSEEHTPELQSRQYLVC